MSANTQLAEPLDILDAARTPQLRSHLMEAQSELIMRKVCFELFRRLRCKARILSCVNGVVSHDSALSGLPDLMIAGVAELKPLHGRIIVAVEGDLVGAVVDEVCGSKNADMYERNDLSNMEIRYGKKMIEITIHSLAEVLSNLIPVTGSITQYETTASMLSIADGQSWMISTTGIFETDIGFGSISVIAPYTGFEPLEAKMSARIGVNDAPWIRSLDRLAENTPIHIRVEIARIRLPIGIVDAMRPGQTLPLLLLPDAIVVAGGIDAFIADYGQCANYVCFRVKDSYKAEGVSRMVQKTDLKDHSPGDGTIELEPLQPLHRTSVTALNRSLFERVNVTLSVELGRTSLCVKDLRQLHQGQVVVLDQMVGEPLAIFANGQKVALGEVVAAGKDQYGIRLTGLIESEAFENVDGLSE